MTTSSFDHAAARNALRRWLPILAVGDIAFLTLNTALRALVHFGWLGSTPEFLSVTADDSLPEIYDYAKWGLLVVVLAAAARRTRAPLFAALAATFFVILLDDSLQFHERLGEVLVEATGLTGLAGLRGQDLGELAVWGGLGSLLMLCLLYGFRRSGPQARRLALPFVGTLAALVFFAVGLDVVHAFIDTLGIGRLSVAFGLAEDGGEMLCASLAGGYALALAAGLGLFRRTGAVEALLKRSR